MAWGPCSSKGNGKRPNCIRGKPPSIWEPLPIFTFAATGRWLYAINKRGITTLPITTFSHQGSQFCFFTVFCLSITISTALVKMFIALSMDNDSRRFMTPPTPYQSLISPSYSPVYEAHNRYCKMFTQLNRMPQIQFCYTVFVIELSLLFFY